MEKIIIMTGLTVFLFIFGIIGLGIIFSINEKSKIVEKQAAKIILIVICILSIITGAMNIYMIQEYEFYQTIIDEDYILVEIDGTSSYYNRDDVIINE